MLLCVCYTNHSHICITLMSIPNYDYK